MSKIEVVEQPKEEHKVRQPRALANVMNLSTSAVDNNPWIAEDVDKFGTKDVVKAYREAIDSCRFFYRRDPLASIVLNKFVDISMTDLKLVKGKVPPNQFRVYESLLDELQDFAESCALEYLVSGLLIPEVDFVAMPKNELQARNIKTYESLMLPDAFWIRDPSSIVINSTLLANKPSYYVEIPEEFRAFIRSEGRYPDGTEDKDLYQELLRMYPDFIISVRKGERLVKLENPTVLRRKTLADSPYPMPYLYPAIESLRHKRNVRKMDYSIAARVISAIMQVRVGNDTFPLTAEDDMQLEELRQQMRWRDSNQKEIERIFQLFTNHTVEIEWIYPDTKTLLDDVKYKSINADILYALGLPQILVTGETERSQSSDASAAMISPAKTMEQLRRKILAVIRKIVFDVADKNGFKQVPDIRFSPMNLRSFTEFLQGLTYLYDTGNLSRTDLDKELGFEFEEQLENRAHENELIKAAGVEEFAPVPHSNAPTQGQDGAENPEETQEEDESGE